MPTPSAFQSVRGRIYDLHWDMRERVGASDFKSKLRFLLASQRWPRAEIEDLRDRKLREAVIRAYTAIPFYRRLMDEYGVRPSDVRGAADLGKLPILDKDTLRTHAAELQATDIPEAGLEAGITGGTTGNPMRVVRDRAGTGWQRGCYWRGFSWGGLSLDKPWVQLFGGSLGQRGTARRLNRLKNWFAGKSFLPAFELGAHNVQEYVRCIEGSGAQFLVGYTSACHQLALLTEAAGLSLRLQAVFPTAELVPAHWADTMARVFGAKVLPYYGSGEIQSLGYTCPDASEHVYHTCDEHSLIEVERPDGTAALEGEGAFLITDLDNRAMPLIRYRNGDGGMLGGPGCPCGRSLGRIMRLDGRVNDVLLTMNGDRISGAIGAHAFRLVSGVESFQIVQQRPGHALVRIVPLAAFDQAASESRLRAVFERHLGQGAHIEFDYARSLPKTPAGKSRFVINEFLASAASGGNDAPPAAPPDAARGRDEAGGHS